jgi:hypothetical protein
MAPLVVLEAVVEVATGRLVEVAGRVVEVLGPVLLLLDDGDDVAVVGDVAVVAVEIGPETDVELAGATVVDGSDDGAVVGAMVELVSRVGAGLVSSEVSVGTVSELGEASSVFGPGPWALAPG